MRSVQSDGLFNQNPGNGAPIPARRTAGDMQDAIQRNATQSREKT